MLLYSVVDWAAGQVAGEAADLFVDLPVGQVVVGGVGCF